MNDIYFYKTSKAPAELDKRQLFEADCPVHNLLVFLRFPQTSHLIWFGTYCYPPHIKKGSFHSFLFVSICKTEAIYKTDSK